MSKDKKKSEDQIPKDLEYLEDESTEANEAIQEDFYSDDESSKPSSSPVPFVAGNTAPLNPVDNKKDKR